MKMMIDFSPREFKIELQNKYKRTVYSLVVEAGNSDLAFLKARNMIPAELKAEVKFLSIII